MFLFLFTELIGMQYFATFVPQSIKLANFLDFLDFCIV